MQVVVTTGAIRRAKLQLNRQQCTNKPTPNILSPENKKLKYHWLKSATRSNIQAAHSKARPSERLSGILTVSIKPQLFVPQTLQCATEHCRILEG